MALNALKRGYTCQNAAFSALPSGRNQTQLLENAGTYLAYFRKRAGDKWARTQWGPIEIQKDSADKVHLAVRVNRFDADDGFIADFETLFFITLKNNKWAA